MNDMKCAWAEIKTVVGTNWAEIGWKYLWAFQQVFRGFHALTNERTLTLAQVHRKQLVLLVLQVLMSEQVHSIYQALTPMNSKSNMR